VRIWQDHLDELGASGDPLGQACELCRSQRRYHDDDASLAQEALERIRVNAIAPGAIRTPINRQAWETEAALEHLLTLVPYGRIGEPEDIARVAVWLASDEVDYVVGKTLYWMAGSTNG
jgi:enoyl-[acyl-carrier-protein] reductase (NADH)